MTHRIRVPSGTFSLVALLCVPLVSTTVAAQSSPPPRPTMSKPPAPMPLKPATLSPFQETTLPNGVRVVLVENHRNPAVVFRLALPAGNIHDPAGKAGTASIVASLLTKGAGTRTAEQLAAAIENTGGSLVAASDDDFLSVYGSVLSNAIPLAFELLGDVVARPTFSEREFDLVRTQTLSGLQLNSASPAFLAASTFRSGLYGAHPYGVLATPTTVRAITRTDVQQFHATRVRPSGALLVVAGDITMAQVKSLATKAFAGWTGAATGNTRWPSPPGRTKAEIVLVHRPGSVQSNVLIGNLAVGPADSSRLAAELATQVLGGGSDGRLFKVLREQKSWTYGAYAALSRPRGIGRFEANAEVRTEVTDSAVVEMLAQLTRLSAEPIPAKELDDTRGGMVGSFPLAIETPNGLAALVAFVKLYGMPANYLQTYRTRMNAVTAAQVSAAVRRVVRPSQALIVVVGDGTKLYERLAKIAPVTMRNADGDLLQPSDLVAKTLPVAFDVTKLKARQDSFVVYVQGQPIGQSVISVESKNDGWTVRENTNLMNGMVVQRTTLETDNTLAPLSLQQGGTMQGQQTKTEIAFAGGRAKGSAQTPSPSGPQNVAVDVELPKGTITGDAVQLVMSLYRWTNTATFTLNIFNAGKGVVQPISFSVLGSETVTVPAGEFECWKIEQKGGDASVVFYVSKSDQRVVKISPVGQPVEFRLAR